MSPNAIAGLNAEVARAAELFATLDHDEWAAASGCVGWRVQDVAQHMAAVFQQIAAGDTIEVDTSAAQGAEASAEMVVQARKGWTAEQVIAAYAEWAPKGVAALAAVPQQPVNIVFDGPAAASYCLAPGAETADGTSDGLWTVTQGSSVEAPTIHTTAHDFISWATQRADWRASCSGDIDHADGAAVLDAINVI